MKPTKSDRVYVHREVRRIAGEVEMGRVAKAHPDEPATAAYYAAIELYEDEEWLQNNPLKILQVCGKDVANDWVDYWNDEPDSASALDAMALRALEENIADELERRNERS